MSLTRNILFSRVGVCRSVRCLLSSEAGKSDSPTEKAPPKQPPAPEQTKASPPSDHTKYQCQTYYEHNDMSFYDIEAAMADKRVGQPSSKTS